MKFTTKLIAIFASTASVSAFTPKATSKTERTTVQKMADFDRKGSGYYEYKDKSIPSTTSNDKSEALPFLKRPHMLDGSMPGDVGFDPFGFAGTKESLLQYREAEIKHSRLAMLAAAGWPLAELFDRKVANIFALEPALDASNRNPSLLNGGLGKISPFYWIGCLTLAAVIDLAQIRRAKNNDPDYFPGNLGWDPLGLYPEDQEGQFRMQLAEIKHGRLAMIAITAFAIQEFVEKYAVTEQTPIFFKPAQTVIEQYGASGDLSPQW